MNPGTAPSSSHERLPELGPILADLGVAAAELGTRSVAAPAGAPALRTIPRDGWALALVPGEPTDAELAEHRNRLWPDLHVVALFRSSPERLVRDTLQGREKFSTRCEFRGVVLAARRREEVLSPTATVAKFDQNAGGWNGEPGRPGYAHFRWMRRYVGLFATPRKGERILDFGCGAGWVGIEAALGAGGASLAAFDPSPEMVRNAEANARANGLTEFRGRTGFGEAPPFDERFELVISSGVVSFSPDQRAWFDGLARCVAPGGRLVVGDLNPSSRGMLHRRATRPLLPARELNAIEASTAQRELERRGFVHEATAGYQLTRPVPQLAHWSDAKLGGALSGLLLAWNRFRAGPARELGAFDSWVMRLRAP
ncbi:MAG: class I SAM-dependent methyltransferase [Planctomycetota bacterium]|nr:class I SAM-dependent methyltransferase [Planctomycetota bacterium]